MDAQLKTKWVEALRSGRFVQTKGTLENCEGANCCLGVLARLQGEDLEQWEERNLESSVLPPNLAAGISVTIQLSLAHMNDGDSADFHKIADYIEKNL